MRISDWSSDVCSSDLPAQMTVAGKVGGQKSVETVLGDLLAGHARAQRQHVGVVVLAAEARRGAVVAERRARAGLAVNRDGHAEAGAQAPHAGPGPAGAHPLRHTLAERWGGARRS